jgi:hypothetical protein
MTRRMTVEGLLDQPGFNPNCAGSLDAVEPRTLADL